jgi:hypothetical protein
MAVRYGRDVMVLSVLAECLISISRQRASCLLSIVIAASCALLFAIATDELFNGLNSDGEIAVSLSVEGPVLLNISEFLHRSRESSYHTQFILTISYCQVLILPIIPSAGN